MRYILVIAGSDSFGGAGIHADIKTITSLGAHALSALTALTAQNSLGVSAIHKVPSRFISKQLEAIADELLPHAVKIGMLNSGSAIKETARFIKKHGLQHVVLDPVLYASTGERLLEPEAISLLKKVLIPVVSVVTPNLHEAGILTGKKVDDLEEMADAAEMIKSLGPDVVITGGHLKDKCVDLLYDGKNFKRFYGSRIVTKHTHGSGCVFSAALATFLAAENNIIQATKMAKNFTRRAIIGGYACGLGRGPVKAGLGFKEWNKKKE